MRKISGWIFLIVLNYFLIFYLIYVLSAITSNIELIKEYQRSYYNIGLRSIWHSQKNCVEFSNSQIYIPKKTSCNFNNIEFETTITFDELGRFSNHPVNDNNKGIAVLGDSFAMGWGVNDNETFSYLLEKKINRPVYNLGVSGYGTIRELVRLEESDLLSKIDTVIIQYCYNDHGENVSYKKTTEEVAQNKYKVVIGAEKFSIWKKFRKECN